MIKTVDDYFTNMIEIEKSKFIAHVFPAKTEEEAKEYIKLINKEHFKATHNCYAYYFSNGYQKSNDDGEPSGTAGIPILEAIKNTGYSDVLVVVTRYFGGIKLGAGGLIRAYSNATSTALHAAPTIVINEYPHYKMTFDYSLISIIEYNFGKAKIKILDKEYEENVSFTFYLEDTSFIDEIQDLCQGKLKFEFLGNKEVTFKTQGGK